MAKQSAKKKQGLGGVNPSRLFPQGNKRKHPRLFLPKYLTEEADRLVIAPAELERVGAILGQWKEDERAQLRAELDAAYFHLYQLS